MKVQLTHLNKIFWPKEGYTKGDLLKYYHQILTVLLPYLKNRPENLLRHPNGIKAESFFQKNMTGELPKFTKTVLRRSESENRSVRYLVCNNLDTLLYMVNLGCIEINPWNSKVKKLEYPDYAILDLDPGRIGFNAVIEAAQAIRLLLEKMEVESFCKTSGKTGLHVFIPLGAKYTHEQSKQFCQLVAQKVNERLPQTTSVVRDPKKRTRQVYLDFLQNRIGQTLACAYSVRPYKGATVSTPLLWSEVNKKLDPSQFTMKTIFKRLDKLGDLWQPTLQKGIDMKKALKFF